MRFTGEDRIVTRIICGYSRRTPAQYINNIVAT
jgi:hypothetical protein